MKGKKKYGFYQNKYGHFLSVIKWLICREQTIKPTFIFLDSKVKNEEVWKKVYKGEPPYPNVSVVMGFSDESYKIVV